MKKKAQVKKNVFFSDPRVRFDRVGPPISKSEIEKAIPYRFSGKAAFVRFYLLHNGGGFDNFVYFYRDLFNEVPRGRAKCFGIYGMYPVPRVPGEKLKGFGTMLQARDASMKGYNTDAKMMHFLETHLPIAYDGSGNDHWLEIPTGRIRWLDHESVAKGPVEMAPSFLDFVSNLVGDLRKEDKV